MKTQYLLLIAGLSANSIDFKLIYDIYDSMKHYIAIGFEPGAPGVGKRLENLASLLTPALVKGLLSATKDTPSKILNPPMFIQHGTPEEIRLYLNNALTSNCFDNSFKEARCMCKSTYSDIDVTQDELAGGTVVVSANNKFKQIVVSYRATESTQNIQDDLDFSFSDLPNSPSGVRVHRGIYKLFLSTFNGMELALTKKLMDPKFKDYVVHITGYSMGGAATIMAIPDIYRITKKIDPDRPIQIYTYMAPRPGNHEFARYIASFNLPITRHIYGNDLVPHTAPRSVGAIHVGQEIFTPYNTNQTIICSQDYDEDPKCAAQYKLINLQLSSHLRPFGTKLKGPPYC